MSYLERIRGPQPTNVVPINGTTRPAAEGLHPYAAAIRQAWVDRLTDLAGRPWKQGDAWDTNCFVSARKLVELANSPWAGYSHADAREDYFVHAPRDHAWDQREKCWGQAEKAASSVMLPPPPPREEWVVPDVTILDEIVRNEGNSADPLARFNLIDWGSLKREEDLGEEWLAEPIIAVGRMTALYSAPKAGKSLLVLELVAAVALGHPVLSRPAQPPVNVLYVDFENDPRGDIKPRLEDMGYDLDDLEGHLHVATFPSMARLDTPQGGMDLLWLAQQVDARVVVIDTVSRTVGGEENDNNTWLNFYRNTGVALKRAGVACLRLDHSGKDRERGMRGGSAKYGDVDMVWRLVAASDTVLELDCTDHRMALDTTSMVLVRRTDPLRHEVSGDPFAVAMDAKEKELAAILDRLRVPTTWGRDKVRRALEDAGVPAGNTLMSRVIKARKLVLPENPPGQVGDRFSGVPGQVSLSPGTGFPVPDLSATDPNSRSETCPGQVGDRFSAPPAPPPSLNRGRGGTGFEADDPDDPDLLVSCKSCHKPTTNGVARKNDGLCATCARTAGMEMT